MINDIKQEAKAALIIPTFALLKFIPNNIL